MLEVVPRLILNMPYCPLRGPRVALFFFFSSFVVVFVLFSFRFVFRASRLCEFLHGSDFIS